jgi:hypothetical protein
MLTALAGGVVVYGWQRLGGDCWSSSFPSAGSTRLLGIAGLVSAAAAMVLGWAAGSRTHSSGARAASIVAFVLGAVIALGAIGLVLLAQAFPLCTD